MEARSRSLAAVTLAASLLAAIPSVAKAAGIAVEEAMVPAKDSGIQLYVRNKHPEGVSSFGPERTLLFVHGATYPAETAFDLPLGGKSWMDFIAGRGFDVYLMDLRGYGRSTRPKEMDQPAEANEPIVTTDVARRDHGADPADPGRMGPRYAALYGAGPVPAAEQRALEALRDDRRGDPHGHHGE